MQFPQRFGPYILERFLASGGMAEVFLARREDGSIHGPVALKRMLAEMMKNPEYATMFRDEAALSARLVHPNIVRVFDFGEADGRMYMAMEFVDGIDVGTLLKRLRAKSELISVAHALRIGVDLCAGIHYAHMLADERGRPLKLIHRDISPQNIMVSLSGEVKVTDFGIAKALGRETHTATGMIKGKVQYMAPEQALGQHLDQRVDQFAAGIVLWEMLVGQRLFAEKSELLTFEKIIRHPTQRPSSLRQGVPPFVDEVVLRALAKNPDERWPDLNAFGAALAQCLAKLGGPQKADLAPIMAYVAGIPSQPPSGATSAPSLPPSSSPSAPGSAPPGPPRSSSAPQPVLHTASPGLPPPAAAPAPQQTMPLARSPRVDSSPKVAPLSSRTPSSRGMAVVPLGDAPPRTTTPLATPQPNVTPVGTPRTGSRSSSSLTAFDPTVALLEPAPRLPTSGPVSPPTGIDVVPRQDSQLRSQMMAATQPRGTPVGLLAAALVVGLVVGFLAAKSLEEPPARVDACAKPSTVPTEIDRAYALLGTAQGLLEAADFAHAEDRAAEANRISGSARGHFLLGTIAQRSGQAAVAISHFKCVIELGAGGEDASRVEQLILGGKRQKG